MATTTGLSAPATGPDRARHSVPPADRPAGKPWAVTDAAEFLGVSVRSLWRLIDAQSVRVARLGRRVLVPDAEVRRLAGEGE